MKRAINILLCFVLSITIVWMSVGFTLVTCHHTGTVSMATEANCCQKRMCNTQTMANKQCHNHSSKQQMIECNNNCMTYSNVKLSTINSVASFDAHQMAPAQMALFALILTQIVLLPLPIVAKSINSKFNYIYKSPPRQYLNFISVLII